MQSVQQTNNRAGVAERGDGKVVPRSVPADKGRRLATGKETQKMKILVAPDTVQITSVLARNQRTRLPTSRPPCFHQIWLDCTDLSIYLVFTSGEVYRYDPNSIDTGRAIIEAFTHGLTFNQSYRLFGVSGAVAPYEKVSSIPGTAVKQYENPPYPGTDPGPCVTTNWMDTEWLGTQTWVPPPSFTSSPPDGTHTNAASIGWTGWPVSIDTEMDETGNLIYTGPGEASLAVGTMTLAGSIPGESLVQLLITQSGTTLVNVTQSTDGTFPYSVPFTLAPGVGVNQTVQIFLTAVCTAVGFPPTFSGSADVTVT